jgi:ferredoxin-NADP reductase
VSVVSSPSRVVSRTGADFYRLRVKRVVTETPDAVSVIFDVPAELADIFRYEAGQFVTLDAPVSSLPVRRCYSMSSSPHVDAELRVTVKRVPGGRVSNWLNDAVSEGSSLAISPPAGRFVLAEGDGDVVLFAGGSGVTPVLSIIKTVMATTDRGVRLLYANRDEESVIFGCEIAALEQSGAGRLTVVHHLDTARGFVTEAEVRDFGAGVRDAEYYVCGPAGFMDTVESVLAESGAERRRIHIERFTVDESNIGAPAVVVPDQVEVSVEMGGRKKTVDYRPGTTLLQTVRAAGLGAPSSCELGSCATCIARLAEGAAAMRYNGVLSEEEVAEGWVLTCQAVPTTSTVRLVYE